MQVRLSKQGSILGSPKQNLSRVSFLFVFVSICVIAAAMILIPGTSTAISGILAIGLILRHLFVKTNRKPLLLEITDNKITYLSEERNELITIESENIAAIDHKFCELRIRTKDESVHNINLLNTGSEQTRWEIKEHIKKLAEEIRH
jgi:low affinity Fe/Cu permease